MTWVVQYNKQSDSIVHDIVKSEFKTEPIALASVPDDVSGDGESSGDNDHAGHQWIMDTGCGSDLISKAKVEDHSLRRSKAKNPIQFQTANVTNISIVHVTLRAQCRLYVSHVMFRLKPHPRQTVAAVVKVCHLWLGRSGVEKCRVDHKIGSKTFMVAELLAKASS